MMEFAMSVWVGHGRGWGSLVGDFGRHIKGMVVERGLVD